MGIAGEVPAPSWSLPAVGPWLHRCMASAVAGCTTSRCMRAHKRVADARVHAALVADQGEVGEQPVHRAFCLRPHRVMRCRLHESCRRCSRFRTTLKGRCAWKSCMMPHAASIRCCVPTGSSSTAVQLAAAGELGRCESGRTLPCWQACQHVRHRLRSCVTEFSGASARWVLAKRCAARCAE